MTLNAQKYANNTREVNGTVTVYNDDVILRVNTSLGAATVNLAAIPANYFNTQYRLYVYDASSNAAVNNITINAGSGQTINGLSSIVLSTNGQRVVIKISSNTSYLAEGYSNTSSAVASVTSAQFYSVVSGLSNRIDAVSAAVSIISVAAANALSVGNAASAAAANALSVAITKNPVLTIQDEGVNVVSAPATINFRGAGVSVKLSAGVAIVSVTTGGGGGSVTSAQLASAVATLSNSISVVSVAAGNALSVANVAVSLANARNKILDIQDESSTVLSNPIGIDFQGAGVSVTLSGQMAVVKIAGGTNFFYARKLLDNSATTYVPAATIGEKSFIAGAELSAFTSVDFLALSGFNLSTGIFTAPTDAWFAVNAKLVTRINPGDVNNPANSAGSNWMNAETYSAEGIGFIAIGIYDKTNQKVITSNKQVVTKSTSDINIDCSIHAIYLAGGNQYCLRVLNKTDYPIIGIPAALSLPPCEAEFVVERLT